MAGRIADRVLAFEVDQELVPPVGRLPGGGHAVDKVPGRDRSAVVNRVAGHPPVGFELAVPAQEEPVLALGQGLGDARGQRLPLLRDSKLQAARAARPVAGLRRQLQMVGVDQHIPALRQVRQAGAGLEVVGKAHRRILCDPAIARMPRRDAGVAFG